jgi:glucan 1,3-beta-glucosidase
MDLIKGVNLGGWLVLERWLTPSLFNGLKAWDEFSFCNELDDQKNEKLKIHRESFITKEDFKWIADHGLNAIRIPVGYWIFGNTDPYIGGIEYLDFAMQEAEENNLGVVIDLHGAPGSQNGWKHSGREGDSGWHKHHENISKTLEVIEKIADRYKGAKNLIGIELLNEPRRDVPFSSLLDYCQRGYDIVRKYCSEDVAVIVSDAFRPNEWQQQLLLPKYKNVWLDCHFYQVFDPKDKKLDLLGHLDKTKNEWQHMIYKLQNAHPVIIGEWSMALDLPGYSEEGKRKAAKAYSQEQLATFSQSKGWFYWNYKTEDQSTWNFKRMLEQKIISF